MFTSAVSRTRLSAALMMGSAPSLLSPAALAQESTREPGDIVLQTGFDHIGAEVHMLESGDRQIYYIDEGEEGWRPVVSPSSNGLEQPG